MYEKHFGFSASPFRLNPDPKFFFGSKSHNKAMAYLHYGLRQGEGFIVITGEIGAGKSILIGHLIDQLDRSNVVAAHLVTTSIEPAALIAHILSVFGLEPAGEGDAAGIEAFEDFLFDQMNRGRRVLLVIDEAQNLPAKTIEEIRMLSNMDYDGTPLFQVFLVGQPEFRSALAKPEMEQFRQRVNASYHLEPLGAEETKDYIRHRLALVGWNDNPSISDEAFAGIHRATNGLPRKINKLCNRILLYCSIENISAIDAKVVATVVADMKAENIERAVAGAKGDEAALAAPREPEETEEAPASAPAAADKNPEPDETSQRKGPPVVIPFETVRKVGQAEEPGASAEKPAGTPAVRETAPPAVEPGEPVSVFDRLRARRAGKPDDEESPAPATLKDVAQAIAAASAGGGAADTEEETARDEDGESAPAEAALAPSFDDDPRGWRRSVMKTIDETKAELKTAHAGIARLRRGFAADEKTRRDKRARALAGLSRVETMLADLRNAGR